ncbi:MAG: glycosyltransferase [Candidatus Pedobacter colombiensis]|uniref:Glycosyltransferase n=1 Tax=Candidatus Pedobacter colombiensis TaxID=3121371 RepID=A0AAJ5WAB7_9SPHI|nr:glycosyltransferase [Pedobacter sp.]WEK19945.1 MAG: glycosyltransferase [Pedobacter sp.]
MAIPKVIYQTFKTNKLPLINRLSVKWLKLRNKDYSYEFYDDERIIRFLKEEYEPEVLQAYNQLNIGAAKADFFRYAILYKKGGVYLDIDAYVPGHLDAFIKPEDVAIISKEKFPNIFVQWALIFEAGHPFLKRTLEVIINNIKENSYPNSVHWMTGPTAYSKAILECIAENPNIPYRIFGQDYKKAIKPRLPFSKTLYKDSQHWKKMEKTTSVLKPL